MPGAALMDNAERTIRECTFKPHTSPQRQGFSTGPRIATGTPRAALAVGRGEVVETGGSLINARAQPVHKRKQRLQFPDDDQSAAGSCEESL